MVADSCVMWTHLFRFYISTKIQLDDAKCIKKYFYKNLNKRQIIISTELNFNRRLGLSEIDMRYKCQLDSIYTEMDENEYDRQIHAMDFFDLKTILKFGQALRSCPDPETNIGTGFIYDFVIRKYDPYYFQQLFERNLFSVKENVEKFAWWFCFKCSFYKRTSDLTICRADWDKSSSHLYDILGHITRREIGHFVPTPPLDMTKVKYYITKGLFYIVDDVNMFYSLWKDYRGIYESSFNTLPSFKELMYDKAKCCQKYESCKKYTSILTPLDLRNIFQHHFKGPKFLLPTKFRFFYDLLDLVPKKERTNHWLVEKKFSLESMALQVFSGLVYANEGMFKNGPRKFSTFALIDYHKNVRNRDVRAALEKVFIHKDFAIKNVDMLDYILRHIRHIDKSLLIQNMFLIDPLKKFVKDFKNIDRITDGLCTEHIQMIIDIALKQYWNCRWIVCNENVNKLYDKIDRKAKESDLEMTRIQSFYNDKLKKNQCT